jgi:hypothetical protein
MDKNRLLPWHGKAIKNKLPLPKDFKLINSIAQRIIIYHPNQPFWPAATTWLLPV